MFVKPDLHTHSTASDGGLTPSELVARALAAGVDLLALTDHDTTAGIAEARAAAEGSGLQLLPGVEVSVTWGGRTVHILGLGVDPADPVLDQGLARLADYRDWRAAEIASRLAAAGIPGALEGAGTFAQGRAIGRTHFARFLVSRGLAADVRDVFKRFLVKGKPGHVPGEWSGLAEAVGWIRAAGGQAAIAHPARYGFTRSKLFRLIGELKEAGGTGIEVVSGSHSREEVLVYGRYARETGLLASAGSDYHGPDTPWLSVGEIPPLPAGCSPIWQVWEDQEASARRACG
jgi:predicted metal-dependent phosphoesterase TrpH